MLHVRRLFSSSIRPDIIPAAVLKSLQKLCDAVELIPYEVATDMIRQDSGDEFFDLLKEDRIELVAVGQVYKAARKYINESVAIKVQRPDMVSRVSLDFFLLNQYVAFLETLFDVITNQEPFHVNFIDCFARGSYDELDYEKEAKNQIFFKQELLKRRGKVHISKVHEDMTSIRCITT